MGRSIHAVTLFALHLATHKQGMSEGPVKAAPAALAGHLCKVTLYSARGKYLNTLYAAPYVFDPATP